MNVAESAERLRARSACCHPVGAKVPWLGYTSHVWRDGYFRQILAPVSYVDITTPPSEYQGRLAYILSQLGCKGTMVLMKSPSFDKSLQEVDYCPSELCGHRYSAVYQIHSGYGMHNLKLQSASVKE